MRCIILFLFYISYNFVFGQNSKNYFEISYGLGCSRIQEHTILGDRYESLPANSLNFIYKLGLSNKISIGIGISVEQRGGKFTSFERELIGESAPLLLGNTLLRNNKNEFAYLSIPLRMGYTVYTNHRLNIQLEAGVYYSWLIRQLWNTEYLPVFTLIESGTLQFDYSTNDYGISASGGLSYQLAENFELLLDYLFQRGLKDVFEDESIEGFHIRNSINVGLRMRIGRN